MTLDALVLEAWREVLGVAGAAPADRFLESGGRLIRAVGPQGVAGRLEDRLGRAAREHAFERARIVARHASGE